MSIGDDYYARDLASPVQHVAASLDKAAGAALSYGELAAGVHALLGRSGAREAARGVR